VGGTTDFGGLGKRSGLDTSHAGQNEVGWKRGFEIGLGGKGAGGRLPT
jgi:hypothetical protein